MKQYHRLKTLTNMLGNHVSLTKISTLWTKSNIFILNLSVYEQYHECQNMYKVIKTIPAQADKVVNKNQHVYFNFFSVSVYEHYHDWHTCNMYKVLKPIPAQAGKVMTPHVHL